MPVPSELRHRVIQIYKELLNLGQNYPLGYSYFRTRLHAAFWKNRNLEDGEEVEKGIRRAEFVKKEIEALYYLKKYRAMKQRYYE